MNPEKFALLLEKLELPKGATDDDALYAIDQMRASLTQMAGNDISEEARAQMIAGHARLSQLTGEATLAGSVRVVESRFALLSEREKEIEREKRDRRALEMAEYRALTGELIKVGAEIPATAWQDERGTIPVQRILDESLPRLRDRVARLKAANGGERIVAAHNVELTETELRAAESRGMNAAQIEQYQRLRRDVANRSQQRREESAK